MGLTSSLLATDKPADKFDDPLKPFVENFKGRGALNDGSKPASPEEALKKLKLADGLACLLYTSPSPRDKRQSRMPSSA